MKTVYFIRHAKSSWADAQAEDHDRVLNSRGERDAPFMSKMLRGKGANPDLIVSSSAARTQITALYFAKEFRIGKEQLLIKPEIYEAYPEEVLKVIESLDNQFSEVLVFGHNPAFTSIVNKFSSDYLANLPTCGIGHVVAMTDDWKDFLNSNPKLQTLHFPKQYFQ